MGKDLDSAASNLIVGFLTVLALVAGRTVSPSSLVERPNFDFGIAVSFNP